jgi:hypothetical protein
MIKVRSASNSTEPIFLYQEHDKIMLRETGQILTVHEDLSYHMEPGIIVKEKIRRLLLQSEVQPVGQTRERIELERWITAPGVPPPPPPNCRRLADPEKFLDAPTPRIVPRIVSKKQGT